MKNLYTITLWRSAEEASKQMGVKVDDDQWAVLAVFADSHFTAERAGDKEYEAHWKARGWQNQGALFQDRKKLDDGEVICLVSF